MAPGDLDRLHGFHIVFQHGLDLPPPHAALIQLKEPLGLQTVGQRIHMGVGYQVVIGEDPTLFGEADVGELLVIVGVLVDRLLDQLPGDHAAGGFVVPAIDFENLRAAVGLDNLALIHIPCGRAESIGQSGTPGGLVGKSDRLAQLPKLILLNQDAGEGVVEHLAQYAVSVLVDSGKVVHL